MIQKLLKAKHWQIFLLTAGIPLLVQIIMVAETMVYLSDPNLPDVVPFLDYLPVFVAMMLILVSVLFGWFYAIGTELHQKIDPALQLNTTRFKIALAIPLIYIILVLSFMLLAGLSSMLFTILANTIFLGIILIHLAAMGCIFYCMYFVAKTIKTAELDRQLSFGDLAGEFFMIWFFPIGIWFLQPRVNALAADDEDVFL